MFSKDFIDTIISKIEKLYISFIYFFNFIFWKTPPICIIVNSMF
ncbi:putative membrane protein [Enterobacter hormaechei subsp. hoffmannii]|nr:putative membrane protein [Enterobacter hormaechei subsp. hoffmannii]